MFFDQAQVVEEQYAMISSVNRDKETSNCATTICGILQNDQRVKLWEKQVFETLSRKDCRGSSLKSRLNLNENFRLR